MPQGNATARSVPGGVHPRNDLNDLTGTEWARFTKSWFIADSRRYHRNRNTQMHPARFPEEMVSEFLQFFTKAGQWVLDPFVGSAATLVACAEQGRNGVGIELSPRYVQVSRVRLTQLGLPTEQHVLHGDAREVGRREFWAAAGVCGPQIVDGLPQFDYVITSPPYWTMLRTSRGGVESTHKRRAKQGLDTHYSDDPRDIGNEPDYEVFIETLGGIFDALCGVVKPGRYLTVVVQNLRAPHGVVLPLAWDLARRISRSWLFQGERIWCQNSKPLGIWGYPRVFVPNYHHHYCLIFRNLAGTDGGE